MIIVNILVDEKEDFLNLLNTPYELTINLKELRFVSGINQGKGILKDKLYGFHS